MSYKLYAPKEFWTLDWKYYIKKQCNGCGNDSTRSVTKKIGFNMDRIIFVNVRPACGIHDWQYSSPRILGIEPSHEHRMSCDRIFFNNLIRIVDAEGVRLKSWAITKWLRRRICNAYYIAVKNFGGNSYWEANNSRDEYREVCAYNLWKEDKNDGLYARSA